MRGNLKPSVTTVIAFDKVTGYHATVHDLSKELLILQGLETNDQKQTNKKQPTIYNDNETP